MSSLAKLPELVGFFSYSRGDDEHSGGALSRLRARIYAELRLQLGCDVRLWQDTSAIPHGTLWGDEIKRAIAESAFFIPIVTPGALASSHCRTEFELFLAREAELGRKDLIFPILYIRVPALGIEDQRRQNDVLEIIHVRQYADWTKIRQHDVASFDVGKQIEDFCQDIVEALLKPWVSPEERRRKEEAEALKRADEERQRRVEAEAHRVEDERRRQEEAKRVAEEDRRRKTAAEAERQRLERNAAAEREAEERRKKEEEGLHPSSLGQTDKAATAEARRAREQEEHKRDEEHRQREADARRQEAEKLAEARAKAGIVDASIPQLDKITVLLWYYPSYSSSWEVPISSRLQAIGIACNRKEQYNHRGSTPPYLRVDIGQNVSVDIAQYIISVCSQHAEKVYISRCGTNNMIVIESVEKASRRLAPEAHFFLGKKITSAEFNNLIIQTLPWHEAYNADTIAGFKSFIRKWPHLVVEAPRRIRARPCSPAGSRPQCRPNDDRSSRRIFHKAEAAGPRSGPHGGGIYTAC
jgi:flagellar biosynthesis GTPase FlhF